MKAVVDTNVLASAILSDSDSHLKALEVLEGLDEWFLPDIVVYEMVWLLHRLGLTVKVVSSVMKGMLNHRKVKVIDATERVDWALDRLVKEGMSLDDFNDKLVLGVALSMKMSVTSFDKGLRKQARRLGVNVMP